MSNELNTPQTKAEAYLLAALEAHGTEGLPAPTSRMDKYLHAMVAKLAGEEVGDLPVPESRMDQYLLTVLANLSGGSGGGGEAETDDRFAQVFKKTITEISDDTVKSLVPYLFENCTALTKVDFPELLGTRECMFKGCTALESVYFPKALSTDRKSFSGCTSLKSVSLPKCDSSYTTFDYVFEGCTSLVDVDMPSAKSIMSYTFSGCKALPFIDLPVTQTLYGNCFKGCISLKTVVLRKSGTACTLSATNAFNDTPFASGKAGGTLLVPSALVESYKTATNWSVIWGYGHNRFLALEDYTVDGTITGEIDWDKLNGGAA